ARADLDLRFQELARDPLLQRLLGSLKQRLRHIAHQIAARRIDEQVLLLDANAKRWVLEGHDSHGGIEIGAIQTTARRLRTIAGAHGLRRAGPRASRLRRGRINRAWCGTVARPTSWQPA